MTPPPVTPAAGIVLGGRYQLTDRIAGGGMGEVWKALDEVLDRQVAVKLLRGEHAEDSEFTERFRAEARHAASLSHPGIAAVYDYGEEEGTAYLVMELVPGEPLSARIARDGALAPDAVVPLLAQAAQALDAAHQAGVVHRDVKPGNLLVTPTGTVKVTDFGIARAADQAPLTRTGEIIGTAQYLSPEQAQGLPATPASDVYSLGVVAHEALSGERPFTADSPVAVALSHLRDEPPALPASVPPGLATAVLTMLAKDPADRPASAAETAALLENGLATGSGDPATQAMPATRATRGPRPAQVPAPAASGRRRAVLVGAGALVLVLALAGLLSKAFEPSPASAHGSGAPSTPTASQPTTAAPRTVTVDPAQYVGKDSATAVAGLQSLGLTVRTVSVRSGAQPAGRVVSIAPTGVVPVGTTVTVSISSGGTTGTGGTATRHHSHGKGKKK